MKPVDQQLKVALLVGTLGQGGAEKQLVYLIRALVSANVAFRVYSLTRGEFYEAELTSLGAPVTWIGQSSNPLFRLTRFIRELLRFGPDLIQSTHTFTNVYAAVAGRLLNRPSLGALRSNVAHARAGNGRWTNAHLRWPSAILANSQTACRELAQQGLVRQERIFLFPNVIEVSQFDEATSTGLARAEGESAGAKAIFVGRLISVKRVDLFLRALAAARKLVPELKGIIIGDGPERHGLEKMASELRLTPDAVSFLGQQSDVPAQLSKADMLVLCSDHEGFPNVLLEAMAARLPVITTPAGDAPTVVADGVTGCVVPFEDVQALADRMATLTGSPSLRRQLGKAGRCRVEQSFSFEGLAQRLFVIYGRLASFTNNSHLLHALPA